MEPNPTQHIPITAVLQLERSAQASVTPPHPICERKPATAHHTHTTTTQPTCACRHGPVRLSMRCWWHPPSRWQQTTARASGMWPAQSGARWCQGPSTAGTACGQQHRKSHPRREPCKIGQPATCTPGVGQVSFQQGRRHVPTHGAIRSDPIRSDPIRSDPLIHNPQTLQPHCLRTMLTTPHMPNAREAVDDTLCGAPFTIWLNTMGAGMMTIPNARKYENEYTMSAASGGHRGDVLLLRGRVLRSGGLRPRTATAAP